MEIIEKIKTYLRKRTLKKYSSTVPTQIMSLSLVKTAVAVIDVEDTSYDTCKEALLAFFREHKIKGEIFYFDFRVIDNKERLITSITNTVLKKDLNWYGKPSHESMKYLDDIKPDMFISLIRGTDFPIEFMARYCPAKFKIGRTQLPGNVFDLVVSDPQTRELSQAEVFDGIKQYIRIITGE